MFNVKCLSLLVEGLKSPLESDVIVVVVVSFIEYLNLVGFFLPLPQFVCFNLLAILHRLPY